MKLTSMLKLTALAIILLAPLPAVAQAPEDDSALRQNCVGDYFRFCATYLPGSKAIRQCFAARIDQLTPECRGAIRDFDRRNPKR
ncbi:hypothetical protein [Beijerinckia sp. L45]|uniref:hypothetical protein n=1 Tax=Beijerinckia sp. L45 TaxID=1641855 RepID=UPI00131AC627|nr:hypothetical protein [Beijerinckia sp. L45]